MTDYRAIFDAVESTLIRVGSQHVPETTIRKRLGKFKQVETKQFTDADYHQILVSVVFYSGFKADTVNKKMGAIRRRFPDYTTVAGYGDEDVSGILSDPKTIRYERKVRVCVTNAREFKPVVEQHGGVRNHV